MDAIEKRQRKLKIVFLAFEIVIALLVVGAFVAAYFALTSGG